MPVQLIRLDLTAYGPRKDGESNDPLFLPEKPRDKEQLITDYLLPPDSIINLKADGKYIPWSLIKDVNDLEIQVLRPHQNVKPKAKKYVEGDDLFRETVRRLEKRLDSLEQAATPAVLEKKDESELEKLGKQVDFLKRRLFEAERLEWIKKESPAGVQEEETEKYSILESRDP